MTGYGAPVPLEAHHELDGFVCRSDAQTAWLRRFARQAQSSGSARVFVVTLPERADVVAYYAWSMSSVRCEDAPERLRKGSGAHPQPLALLARLGVHTDHEGNGLAQGMLRDAILRLVEVADVIGCRGLLIHAESEDALSFYRHVLPSIEQSPFDPFTLVLLMKDVRKTVSK